MSRRKFLKLSALSPFLLTSLPKEQAPDSSVVERQESYTLRTQELLIPTWDRGFIIDQELNNYARELYKVAGIED